MVIENKRVMGERISLEDPHPLFLRMYGNNWTYGRPARMYGNDWTYAVLSDQWSVLSLGEDGRKREAAQGAKMSARRQWQLML
jgi:hypothetical protein